MAITRLGGANAITGTLPAANINDTSIGNITALPAGVGGKVLQVVGANISGGNVDIASTTYTDTGNTVTITPSSSSSKIMIFARGSYLLQGNDDKVEGGIKLVRNIGGGSFSNLVSPVADTNGPYETKLELTAGGTAQVGGYYNYCFLDTPNTTSACIYKLQARVYNTANSQQIRFGNTGGGGGAQSQQMIAQEVSG